MIRRLFILFGLAFLGFSCAEDEVVPRTNPRFSVALIQGVNEDGVEFSANIYDYGSEEILEYGFVFGANPKLNDPNAEILSMSGRPEKEFKLRAVQGLERGKPYFVVAYLKTQSGIVYSGIKEFVSEGSRGYVLGQIIAPEEVFFGDILIFEGENLPKNQSQIQVKIEGFQAEVISMEGSQFKVKIPDVFEFDPERAKEGRFQIDLKVSVKQLSVEKILNFRKPKFILEEIPEVAYTDRIRIKGADLRDLSLQVKYEDENGKISNLEVLTRGDNLVEVLPNALFTEANPKLIIRVRGIEYQVANSFKLKPTKLNKAQTSKFDGWYAYIELNGENFNPLGKEYNRVELQGSTYHLAEITEFSADRMKITLVPDEGVYSREILVRTNMGPGLSQDAYRLEVSDPRIPVQEFPYQFITSLYSVGVSFQNKGYFVSSEGVFEFSSSISSPKRLFGPFPSALQFPFNFTASGEGNLYFSDGKKLMRFNLNSNQPQALPDLPNNATENLGFFVNEGYLYAEYGTLRGYFFDPSCSRRFRLNLSTLIWEELAADTGRYYIGNKTFKVNGDLYSYRTRVNENTNNTEIARFNSNTKSWEFVKTILPGGVQVRTNEVYVIGENVYFLESSNSFVLNSSNWTQKNIDNVTLGIWPKYGFQIEDKLYQFNFHREKSVLYEIDPDYFVFR
ncbi:hypothetical protein DFQ04_2521 [Algoriphagus boseongensis]|uniref:IPT/TIG domain-containing protein n=1 Tax=Algoriphagus boseongensis TaxID=1442587 RepID=A0A4V6PW44_9BACT|nr:hypothetical protein [Algoriphagus boseongensis]TDQ16403.1 hypothetical protein DFQ04_2521 [Algoriphagus boseongensis]